jgi:hypothetical protein
MATKWRIVFFGGRELINALKLAYQHHDLAHRGTATRPEGETGFVDLLHSRLPGLLFSDRELNGGALLGNSSLPSYDAM